MKVKASICGMKNKNEQNLLSLINFSLPQQNVPIGIINCHIATAPRDKDNRAMPTNASMDYWWQWSSAGRQHYSGCYVQLLLTLLLQAGWTVSTLSEQQIDYSISSSETFLLQSPVAARSKTWVCHRSLAGIARSNPAGGMDVCHLWVAWAVK